MKLLAILRPTGEVRAAVMERASTELAALWGLYRDGFVREMYSPAGLGSVLVLEAASPAEATERLSELPLLRDGIMDLEIIELHPFAALAMLFAKDQPD